MPPVVTSAKLAETGVSATAPASSRLMSLDLFRGLTIAGMILVNDPGNWSSVYAPLRHSEWNGWTPTDLVFPFFVFIVGVAMAFSFSSRLQRGDSRLNLFKHVLWRGVVLFAMGVFLNGFPTHYDPAHLRIYGVLQRIAICYVLTAMLELWGNWRSQLGVLFACLAGYWVLMRFVPVPGYGMPTHGIPLLDPDRNIVAWLDRKLLMGHLYEHTRDPEGLLSDIPALATCLAGLLTGKWLRTLRSGSAKAWGMAIAGVGAIAVGRTWHWWFPINKKLWTSSYVIFTAGLALVCLAVCYWISDVKQHRGAWTKPILVFGKNAIAAYFLSEALAALMYAITFGTSSGSHVTLLGYLYSHLFAPLASPVNASLLYALAYVGVCWLVMAVLYRKGIFLKI
jgi:predicted acyltransferase